MDLAEIPVLTISGALSCQIGAGTIFDLLFKKKRIVRFSNHQIPYAFCYSNYQSIKLKSHLYLGCNLGFGFLFIAFAILLVVHLVLSEWRKMKLKIFGILSLFEFSLWLHGARFIEFSIIWCLKDQGFKI